MVFHGLEDNLITTDFPTGHKKNCCSCTWSTSSQTLRSAGLFSIFFLTPFSAPTQHFYNFLNMLSQRDHQLHRWAQLWPAVGLVWSHLKGLCGAQGSPQSFLTKATSAASWLPKPCHIKRLKGNCFKLTYTLHCKSSELIYLNITNSILVSGLFLDIFNNV